MRALLLIVWTSFVALGQSTPNAAKNTEQNPPVKVNVLNVCTPSVNEQQELSQALAIVPKSPAFDSDYEVSRGVSTIETARSARYVRLRRELRSDSPLVTIQYSLSADPENTVETVVFRGREAKDLLALSIEDRLSTAVSKPATVIQSETPASRVRLERAGKTTIALARCEGIDQSRYEPIFAQASSVFADYRRILKLRTMLASEIAWLSSGSAGRSPGTGKNASGASSEHPN
ncbi:MAG TPA: hypothetical protein VG498_08315 [Terriglobales bacterium]|nr:hypothetical protein [Terriglobales bacterium]